MDFYLVAGTEELETRLACEVCDVVVSVVVVVDVGFNGAAVCARLIRGRLEHPVSSIQNAMLQFLPYCVYNSELGLMSFSICAAVAEVSLSLSVWLACGPLDAFLFRYGFSVVAARTLKIGVAQLRAEVFDGALSR